LTDKLYLFTEGRHVLQANPNGYPNYVAMSWEQTQQNVTREMYNFDRDSVSSSLAQRVPSNEQHLAVASICVVCRQVTHDGNTMKVEIFVEMVLWDAAARLPISYHFTYSYARWKKR